MTSDTAARPGLRERRRVTVKRSIALCAVELFERQGFANTTVEQIAAAAGISLRTFYRHCQVKEEVLTSLLTEGADELVAELARRPASEPLSVATRSALVHSCEYVHPETRRIARIVLGEPALRARWLSASRQAQDLLVPVIAERLGDHPDELRPAITAGLIVNLSATALEYWVTHDGDDSLAETVDAASRLVGALAGVP